MTLPIAGPAATQTTVGVTELSNSNARLDDAVLTQRFMRTVIFAVWLRV